MYLWTTRLCVLPCSQIHPESRPIPGCFRGKQPVCPTLRAERSPRWVARRTGHIRQFCKELERAGLFTLSVFIYIIFKIRKWPQTVLLGCDLDSLLQPLFAPTVVLLLPGRKTPIPFPHRPLFSSSGSRTSWPDLCLPLCTEGLTDLFNTTLIALLALKSLQRLSHHVG